MRAHHRFGVTRAGRTRKHAIAVGVGLLALAGAPAAASANPSPLAASPPSLAGETFNSIEVSGSTINGTCTDIGDGSFTFSVSGTAAGPYPGTFTESGSFTMTTSFVTAFSATFTITSTAGSVTGSKSLLVGNLSTCTSPGFVGPEDPGTVATEIPTTVNYTATINGAYQDTGTGTVSMYGAVGPLPVFNEGFVTSNGVVPLAPTSKDQCKNGGWQTYPQFKNQGDCISYVENGK